ncbi:hypothetical protein GGI43DRAFT_426461 [Trichoderma evansii]
MNPVDTSSSSSMGSVRPSPTRGWQSTTPCRYFREGRCWSGEKCPFLHEPSLLEVQNMVSQEEPASPVDPEDILVRMFDGALVEFDAGARVTKVRFQCDFSAVRIRSSPRSITKQLVRDMLEEFGFGDCVEEVHMTEDRRYCEATVIANSPSFAKQFCERVVPGFRWRDMSIRAWSVAALVPRAFNDRQVDCRKVTVSWPRPGREAILSYGNSGMAKRVCTLFNRGSLLILGQRVAAAWAPAAGPDRVAFKVTLTLLPHRANVSDVRRAVGNGLTPRDVEIGGHVASAGETFSAVHSLLAAIGPLESFDTIDDSADTQLKVAACFLNQLDGLRAARELDKAAPSFYPRGQLSVRATYTVRFAVNKCVYDAMRAKLVTVTSERSVFDFGCDSLDPAIKVFKIEGESASDVAEAKKKVESILSGVVVEDDGAALWHPTLQANGLLCEKVADLEKQLGVIIARDPVRCNLRVFGSDEACNEAQDKVVELVHRESGTDISRSIPLKDPKSYWGTNTGFQKLVDVIGPGKLWLNMANPSKVIEMKGTLEDYDLVRDIIVGKTQVTEDPAASGGKPRCFVCYWPSKQVDVTLVCHSYPRAMSVASLRKHLSPKLFERGLKDRFLDHVKCSPDKFRPCPTPDCGYVYKIRGTECLEWHICSNCLKTTCSVYHSQHLGM